MSSHRPRATFSQTALRDIDDILLYTGRTWGVQQRRTYRSLLRDTFQRLASMPSLGKVQEGLDSGLHSYPAGGHIVYYQQEGDSKFVVRVLHSRQDPNGIDWSGRRDEPNETT
jgi:toxin ParE1/3/4